MKQKDISVSKLFFDIIKSIFDIKIIDKHGFLYIIRKLLKKIGYKIISKKKYDKKFYMIEKFTVL